MTKSVNKRLVQYSFIFLLLFHIVGQQVFAQTNFPEKGVYDGKIDGDQLILVVETVNPGMLKGYYVLNRANAVEEGHAFSYNTAGSQPIFQSDLYLGKMKSMKTSPSSMEGILLMMNKKKRFFFWRPKASMSLQRRPEYQVTPSARYQKEIFNGVEVKSNLLYGRAKGLWTNSPYTDEPYYEVLGKGLVKSFNDPEQMNLNLDIYYPKTDIFKNRPLIMLIHGGAFYIGSKESAAEQSLATSLAKRGYLVASIDYRLGFKPVPSDVEMSAYRAVQDAHAALRYLSHNAKGLGIDPEQVYVGGTSAGAVASLNVAFMDNDERPDGIMEAYKAGQVTKIEESGNKYTEDFKIKAVANMWGAVADLDIFDRDEKISVLSIHGTADGVVPYEYDHPFQNSLMFNRMLMSKMYGSKPIHDRLQMLGKRNRLVSLKGLGHEPELDNYKTLNKWMDTITSNVSNFFYEETAPAIALPSNQLTISESSEIKTIYYEVTNGFPVQIKVTGGVKTNANPTDASFIWLKDTEIRNFTILSKNKFEAWNSKTYRVTISN